MCVCRGGVVIKGKCFVSCSISPGSPPIFCTHLFLDNKFNPNINLLHLVSCLIFLSEFPISYIIFGRWSILKDLAILDLSPHPYPNHLYSIFYLPYFPLHPLFLQQHFIFFTWCLISFSLPQGMYHVSHIVSTDAHQTCSDLKLGTQSVFHLEIKQFSFSHCLKVYEKKKCITLQGHNIFPYWTFLLSVN